VWVGAGKLSCKDGPHGGGNGPRKKESLAGPISAEKEKQPRSGFQGFDFFLFSGFKPRFKSISNSKKF
jgi:hypothetical protein